MRNVDPYGRSPERAIPFRIDPIACSRIPKWKLRPLYLPLSKSPAPFIKVLVEGARSAAPPMNHGTCLAIAFITLLPASRPATPFASAGKVGMSVSQPSGNLPACSVSHSLAKAALLVRKEDSFLPHSSSHCLPRSEAF